MTQALANADSLEAANVRRYVPTLTGVRAVAAYLVFLHHYNPALPGTFVHRLLDQGYIGVSIFFMLSGFLIYHRYADACINQKNWSWRGYLKNRFARIFPLYALLFWLTAGVGILQGQPMSLRLFVVNLTLLKGFFNDIKFSGIAQSWSLTVEACFYLLAPFLFTGLRYWGAYGLSILLVCIGLLLWATVGQTQSYGLFGSLPFVLFYTFFGRAFEFVVGIWLARRWHQNQLPNYQFATFLGSLLISVCIIWQANVAVFSNNVTELMWSEFIAYNCFLPLGIGLVFLDLLRTESVIHWVLSLPVFQALGRSSYAFYLIHIGILANGLQKAGLTNGWLLFISLVTVAHGLNVFIEKPLHQCLAGRHLLR